MGFSESLIIFIFLYIITIIFILIGIWYIFINKTKNLSGEYCNDTSDCASGLRCTGGNQCTSVNDPLSGEGGDCISNSQCKLGLLCISGTCSVPTNNETLLTLTSLLS